MHDKLWGFILGAMCTLPLGLFIGKVIGQAMKVPGNVCDRCWAKLRT